MPERGDDGDDLGPLGQSLDREVGTGEQSHRHDDEAEHHVEGLALVVQRRGQCGDRRGEGQAGEGRSKATMIPELRTPPNAAATAR